MSNNEITPPKSPALIIRKSAGGRPKGSKNKKNNESSLENNDGFDKFDEFYNDEIPPEFVSVNENDVDPFNSQANAKTAGDKVANTKTDVRTPQRKSIDSQLAKRKRLSTDISYKAAVSGRAKDKAAAWNAFRTTTGSTDGVEFYQWCRKHWRDGEVHYDDDYDSSDGSRTPTPKKQRKLETSSTKKKRKRVWNKLGHKFAKSLINEANKLINVGGVTNDNLNKKLIDISKKKMKKKDADDVRDIANDAIDFMEEIAFKTTFAYVEPITGKEVHTYKSSSKEMQTFFDDKVKNASINEILLSKERLDAMYQFELQKWEAILSKITMKRQMLDWREAKKASSALQNVSSYQTCQWLKDHADADLESDPEEEQNDQIEEQDEEDDDSFDERDLESDKEGEGTGEGEMEEEDDEDY